MKTLTKQPLSGDEHIDQLTLRFLTTNNKLERAFILEEIAETALGNSALEGYYINFLNQNPEMLEIWLLNDFSKPTGQILIKHKTLISALTAKIKNEENTDYISNKAYILHRTGLANLEEEFSKNEKDPHFLDSDVKISHLFQEHLYKFEPLPKNLLSIWYFSNSDQTWNLILTMRRITNENPYINTIQDAMKTFSASLSKAFGNNPNQFQSLAKGAQKHLLNSASGVQNSNDQNLYAIEGSHGDIRSLSKPQHYVLEYVNPEYLPEIANLLSKTFEPTLGSPTKPIIEIIDIKTGLLTQINQPYVFIQKELENYLKQNNHFLPAKKEIYENVCKTLSNRLWPY